MSTLASMYWACCSSRWRCRMGIVEYMLVKKKSRQSLTISGVSRLAVGANVEITAGGLTPFMRFWTLVERLVCRCVSRSSLMTLALEPLGPFFWGMALYVQASWAEEQLRHGLIPSHLTLRRWQASQALFTAVVMAGAVESSGERVSGVELAQDFGERGDGKNGAVRGNSSADDRFAGEKSESTGATGERPEGDVETTRGTIGCGELDD